MRLPHLVALAALLAAAALPQSASAMVVQNQPVEVSVAGAIAKERTGAPARLSFEVSLSRVSDEPVEVRLASIPLTAARGVDFVNRTDTITIPAGSLRRSFIVQVVGDRMDEDQETLRARIMSATGADIATRGATGTIDDDDPQPTVWMQRAHVSEADGSMPVRIRLSNPSENQIDVGINFRHATTSDDDFWTAPLRRTLSIRAGSVEASTTLMIHDDDDAERDERLIGFVAGAIGATPIGVAAELDILDDDRG